MLKPSIGLQILCSFILLASLYGAVGSQQTFTLGTTPGNPASGKVRLWANSATGNLECLNSSGGDCLGTSLVQQVTVNVSAAEITTLNASPKTIVAAQGAGTFIELVSAEVEFVSNGTQYTSGNNLFFKVNNNWVSSGYGAANFDGLTATRIISAWLSGGSGPVAVANDVRNQALVFTNDSGPEYATGNGTLIIHANYIVHTGF